MFFGRDTELKLLEESYHSKKSELFVIYGRRRIGKSRLLEEFSKNKNRLLFEGLEHIRLAVVLLSKTTDSRRSVHTTTYNKWMTEAREHLFQSLRFVEVTKKILNGSMPKIGSEVEGAILGKLHASNKTLAHFVSKTGRNRILYTRKLSWFVQILDFVPSITDEHGRKRDPSELKEVTVSSEQQRNIFLCALNSSLFYWLLTVWSDCRNLNKREVLGVPLDFDALKTESRNRLGKLVHMLMTDFRKNSQILNLKILYIIIIGI